MNYSDYPNRPMFAVDWDGTCVAEYREDGTPYWPEMGPWLPGAVEALRELASVGKVVIYTLRAHLYEMDDRTARPRGEAGLSMSEIQAMLTDAGLGMIDVYPPNRGKPPAVVYIDDRGMRFTGNWPVTVYLAKRFAECATVPNSKYEYRYDFGPESPATHKRPLGSRTAWERINDNTEDAMGSGQEFGLRTRQVVESASGVKRDTDEGKPQPILCFDGPMFDRWADHLTKGIEARGKRNWMKGCDQADLDRYEESAVRHFRQWLRGDTDEDHAAALFFNINGAEYVKARLAQDSPPELHAA